MGNERFFGLFVISAGVHAAALLTLGWTEPSTPSAGGALRVSLASPPSAVSADPADRAVTPVARPLPKRPQPASPSQAVTTQARQARPHVARLGPTVTSSPTLAAASAQPTETAVADARPSQRPKAPRSSVVVEPVHGGPVLAAVAALAEESAQPTATPAAASAAADSAGDRDAHRRSAGDQLLAALQDHFAYPLRARRRGWEGDVVLGVDLDESGVIAEVRLLASSGYGALDRAAIASMRAVGALEHSLFGRLSVAVPVRYRLIN